MIATVALGLVIGLALGALGGGGSILAVPVLAHLAGQSVGAATATSLVAVGVSAAVGATGHSRAGRVRWGAAATFVAVGVVGSWTGAWVNHRVDGDVLLLAFSALVLVAAHRMLTACPSCTREGEERELSVPDRVPHLAPVSASADTTTSATTPALASAPVISARLASAPIADPAVGPALAPASAGTARSGGATAPPARSSIRRGARRGERSSTERRRRAVRVAAAGTLVGFLTGAFGVGGGFVVVPALTLVLGLSMPVAIGTSLVVVAGNAAVALAIRGLGAVSWDVAVPFTATMLVGSLIGGLIAPHLPARRSLHAFAALLVVVALANGAAAALALTS